MYESRIIVWPEDPASFTLARTYWHAENAEDAHQLALEWAWDVLFELGYTAQETTLRVTRVS